MNKWKETTLGKIAEKMFSGGTPSTQRDDFYGGNIPWLRTQEINFNYIYDTDIKITEEGLKYSSARWIPENAVIIAMYGNSAGRTAFSKIKTTTNQACCNFVADLEKADPLFVYFNLLGRHSEIEGMANGAAQQNLSVGGLKELKILLPPLSEQKQIAAVLSSLDDKIELLRMENETLEKIAQGIFKEWFVNFNLPAEVLTKVGDDGKKLKLKNGVPEGWRSARLGEFFQVLTGKRNANHAREKGQFPFFTCSQGSFMCDEYSFDGSAILLSGNGDFNLKWFEGKFDAYQRTYVLMPHKKELIGYLFFAMKYYLNDLTIGQRGSVIKFLTKGMIEDFELFVPNDEKKLENIAEPFYKIIKRIDFNKSQIQTLSHLRDTLLPKLMSGEKFPLDKSGNICNTDMTGFREKSKRLSEVEKTVKTIKKGRQTLKEHHLKLQTTTAKLTKEGKDDILKVEVDGLKFSSSSASSFRGTMESNPNSHRITENFSCDFFILKKEIEEAVKKIKNGPKNKKDSQYNRFDFISEIPDEEKLKENSLSKFLKSEKENIEKICFDILRDKYKIDPYFGFLKNKGNGKTRPILAPSIKDKIVFTWILNKIKREFLFLTRYNIFGSYPNKRKIVDILKDILKATKKYSFILKIDIKNFYPSIDRNKLLVDLERERIIKSKYFLKLIEQAFGNKIDLKNKKELRYFPKTGIPQGCAFSPLLANYYAYKIDKYLKDRELVSFRYLDDLIIFTKNFSNAKKIFLEIKELFEKKSLHVHPLEKDGNKSYIVSTKEPFEYLGVKIENGKFKIPDEKIEKILLTIKTGILNKGTIKKFKKVDILKSLENYISGVKSYYISTCEKHFLEIRSNTNDELRKYYKRFPETVEYISNIKYYL